MGTVSRVGYRFVAEVSEEPSVPAQRHEPVTDRLPASLGAPVASVPAEAAAPVASLAPSPIRRDSIAGGQAGAPARWLVYAATVTIVALGGLAVWFGIPWRPAVRDEPRHQLVSTFDGSHRSATLSPDGRMVAFLMEAAGVPQVWIKSIASGSPVQITFGEVAAGRPRWSPRGDQILFERRDRGIWSVPPLGGEARQIIEAGHSPNFSQDGSTIVFEMGRTNPKPLRWSLWLANADGSNRRQIEGTPDKQNWAEPAYPAFSPDGQWIAFFRHTDGPRGDIWIVRASGGDARALTNDERQAGAPVWTPDSRAVVFPSERRGSRTLWKASIAGGSIEPLTTGAGSDDEPDISRDGRSLIYTNFKDHHALAVWDPVTGERKTVVKRPLPLIMPDVSPQGDRVAFFVEVGADVQIFVAGIDGQDVRQVTHGQRPGEPPSQLVGRRPFPLLLPSETGSKLAPHRHRRTGGCRDRERVEVGDAQQRVDRSDGPVCPLHEDRIRHRRLFERHHLYLRSHQRLPTRARPPASAHGAMVAGRSPGGGLAPRRHHRGVRGRQWALPHARAWNATAVGQ